MVEISAASHDDVLDMAELFQEMDEFYGDPAIEPVDHKADQISAVLFGETPLAFALLAWDNGQLVGFASYSILWPAAGTTKSLYLKELYVKESHRGTGAGRHLMRELFRIALDSNCSRVEWTTDTDNLGAQGFYEKLRLPALQSKVFYRADRETLHRFA
jgi:ribosomal protein S18 acetylase RimI-like enzyme